MGFGHMFSVSSSRYASVVSTLALVIALGGTTYAAATITGKDIKNNSVTSNDVKNGNLKAKDLAKAVNKSLAGPTVFSVHNGYQTLGGAPAKTLLALPLPAGDYAVHSKLLAQRNNSGSAYLLCYLVSGDTVVDTTAADVVDIEGGSATVVNQAILSLAAPGSITLSCEGSNTLYWSEKWLTATKVGSLTSTVGPNVA